MHKLFIICCLALTLPACKTGSTTVSATSSAVKRYLLAGKVVSVDKDKKTIKVDHEGIPGYMDAMTMVYPVKTSSWDRLNPGADIRADLVVDSSAEQPAWLENIVTLASTEQEQPPGPEAEDLPTKESRSKGDALPNFRLTNQDGKKFSLRDYRGRPWQ